MFRSILIDDFMTKNLATATRDMDLLALVDLLLRRGISGTPVVDQSGHLIGMVSEHDCLKAILVGNLSRRRWGHRRRCHDVSSGYHSAGDQYCGGGKSNGVLRSSSFAGR